MRIRERIMDCGNYRDVAIYCWTDAADQAVKGSRKPKQNATNPKQQKQNAEYKRKELIRLCNGNFGSGDYVLTCSYANDYLPVTPDQANRNARNYIRRLGERRKKLGLSQLKYILVTVYVYDDNGNMLIRVHHHIIINGGLEPEEAEMMWTTQRINWRQYDMDPDAYRKKVPKMGYINADRLVVGKNGAEALCNYLANQGKKINIRRVGPAAVILHGQCVSQK